MKNLFSFATQMLSKCPHILFQSNSLAMIFQTAMLCIHSKERNAGTIFRLASVTLRLSSAKAAITFLVNFFSLEFGKFKDQANNVMVQLLPNLVNEITKVTNQQISNSNPYTDYWIWGFCKHLSLCVRFALCFGRCTASSCS